MRTYGVDHALSCSRIPATAATIPACSTPSRRAAARFKGIAIIDLTPTSRGARIESARRARRGVQSTFHGTDYYKRFAGLIEKLAELDMFLQIQSEHDQLSMFVPWIEAIPVRVLIDHCGRPTPREGFRPAGLSVAAAHRPHRPCQRQAVRLFEILARALSVRGLLAVCARHRRGLHARRCMWASDWPFCARRNGRTTARWSNCRNCCSPIRPSGANCFGRRRSSYSALAKPRPEE